MCRTTRIRIIKEVRHDSSIGSVGQNPSFFIVDHNRQGNKIYPYGCDGAARLWRWYPCVLRVFPERKDNPDREGATVRVQGFGLGGPFRLPVLCVRHFVDPGSLRRTVPISMRNHPSCHNTMNTSVPAAHQQRCSAARSTEARSVSPLKSDCCGALGRARPPHEHHQLYPDRSLHARCYRLHEVRHL